MSFFADIEMGFWVLIAIIWGAVKLVGFFSNDEPLASGKRKITRQHQTGNRVVVEYFNASGGHRSVYVNADTATRHGDRVRVNRSDGSGRMELVFDRIKNPEVLGLAASPAPAKAKQISREKSEFCAVCGEREVRMWEGQMRCWHCGQVVRDEPVPPSPVAKPSGKSGMLLYWDKTKLHDCQVQVEAYWTQSQQVQCIRTDTGKSLVLDADQIINPDALTILNTEFLPEPATVVAPDEDEEEPPILEPKALKLGDPSGRELIYTQKGGDLAVIYFDPATVEQVGKFVNLSPMGIDERYAITLQKIINPNVLDEESEPLPPVLSEPEPLPPVLSEPEPSVDPVVPKPKGYLVTIRRSPLDSYDAVNILRKHRPELNAFEAIEFLDQKDSPVFVGEDEEAALRIGGELESAGCTGDLKFRDAA